MEKPEPSTPSIARACACVGVELGSYANVVTLFPPAELGLSRVPVTVDRYIAQEILRLWDQGIRTLNSCCGHNKAPAFIVVCAEHESRMEALGYRALPDRSPRLFHPQSLTVSLRKG
jgi:hypothetical protein